MKQKRKYKDYFEFKSVLLMIGLLLGGLLGNNNGVMMIIVLCISLFGMWELAEDAECKN